VWAKNYLTRITRHDAIAAELAQRAVGVATAVAADVFFFAEVTFFAEAEHTVTTDSGAVARRCFEPGQCELER
jgi:hypothetical protein